MAVKNGYSGPLKRPRLVYSEDRKDPVDMAAGMVRGELAAPAAGTGGQWSDPLNDAANKYLNREKFHYDVNEDALYHQYKDLYTAQGQQAMLDTMGQAATLTGGYGNSYAQTAGQQAYQGHIQKLGEVVPELYQLALDRYKMEGDQMRDRASFLAQMDDRDYSRWESERNFQYQKDQDAEDKRRYDQEFSYQQGRDDKADQQWQTEYDENRRRYDQEWEEDKWRYDTEWAKKYGKKPDRGDGGQDSGAPGGAYGGGTGGGSGGSGGGSGGGAGGGTNGHESPDVGPDELPQEPDPKKTPNTDRFIAGMMSRDEAKRRGITEKEYFAMIRDRINNSGLSDGEIRYLLDYYGFA